MSDTSDDTPDQPADHTPHLDVEAEKKRLEDLGHEIEEVREKAEDDLTVGGEGRPFADEGVRKAVEEHGDPDYSGG